MKNKIIKFLQENGKIIILMIGLLLFFFLLNYVLHDEALNFDRQVYRFIMDNFYHENLTKFFKFITEFGDKTLLIILTILSYFFFKSKKIGIIVTFNLVFTALLNWLLKIIIQRPRPLDLPLISVGGYSFPSGHSMVSMAFYGLLIYLVYIKVDKKCLRWGIIAFLILLIFLIGISRIYLGVHYPTDVLAGFLLSFMYLLVFVKVIKKYI